MILLQKFCYLTADTFLYCAGRVLLEQGFPAVAVRTGCHVPSFLEDEFGLALSCVAVIAGHRGKVELEEDPHFVEFLKVLFAEVAVALGVGQERAVSRAHDFPELARQVVWLGHDRSLDQEHVVLHRQQVAVLEPLVEDRIEHVLGGKVQPDGSAVGTAERVEACLEVLGRVRTVLHHMRGAPPVSHAQQLSVLEDLKGIFDGLYPVVHTREDVGMAVCSSLKHSVLRKGASAAEYIKHTTRFYRCRFRFRSHSRSHSRNRSRIHNRRICGFHSSHH